MTRLFVSKEIDTSDRDAIHHMLREYNRSSNPDWWSAMDRIGDPIALIVLARGPENEILGGLIGDTRLSWLKVQLMVVRSDQRRRGIGRSMLQAAETEALRRKCRYSFVDTMQYQSPDFYRGCDYQQAGQIDDWDSHGHAKFLFTKRLCD